MCPTRNPVVLNPNSTKTVSFYGEPITTYQIYRTQLASGSEPANGLGNGRYQWLAEVTSNNAGYGEYIDSTYSQDAPGTWYEVLYFDTESGIHGCHSEPVGPTAVGVTNFAADYDLLSEQVNLRWETAHQYDMQGFNVLRQAPGEEARVQVNQGMIPVEQPGSGDPAVFEYVDTDVEFGIQYSYWIEVIETTGLTSQFGPVKLDAMFRMFVPVLQK
ncbi:MAG: hypothetical protein PHW11_04920 [Anaerolineaceae bacterium]|nr:hypothetical protein [Anaerolineaceae bacterium]